MILNAWLNELCIIFYQINSFHKNLKWLILSDKIQKKMASPSYHLSFNQYWLTSNLAVTVPLGASMIARWLSSVRSWGNGPSAISSVLTSSLSVILTKTQQMQTVSITRDSITTAQVIFPTISCVREVIAAESTLGRSMFLDIKLFTYWAKDQCQYQINYFSKALVFT